MFTIKVTPHEGDAYTVTANLFAIVAWERKYKAKAYTLAAGFGLEDLAYIAYETCKQNNVPVSPVFDEYLRKLSMVELVDADTDPTHGGQ